MQKRSIAAAWLSALVLAVSTIVALNAPAQAYNLGACRWGGVNRLTWANFSGTTGIYADAMNTAATRWNNKTSPVNITYTSADYYYASFAVNTSNFCNVSWSGRAPNFDSCPSGSYTQYLPLQLNTYYLAGYRATERAMVAGHEMTHNMGMRHVGGASTPCTSVALMNPEDSRRMQCDVHGPRDDDVAGINAKY